MYSASLYATEETSSAPPEIAAHTNTSETSASTTLTRLFKKELVECSQGVYYVDLDRAEELQHRLESADAAERLHDTAPDDEEDADEGDEDGENKSVENEENDEDSL